MALNRVILYDDKVIILYNSSDREVRKLTKKQLKEAENAESLEGIKENSLELFEFKRVSFGGEIGRDALRKQHSALFLAKAREEAMLRAFEPLGENPVADK